MEREEDQNEFTTQTKYEDVGGVLFKGPVRRNLRREQKIVSIDRSFFRITNAVLFITFISPFIQIYISTYKTIHRQLIRKKSLFSLKIYPAARQNYREGHLDTAQIAFDPANNVSMETGSIISSLYRTPISYCWNRPNANYSAALVAVGLLTLLTQ
jgi:hypothetical protein